MTPRELKTRLERGETIRILDVREPMEWNHCNVGGIHIPLGELESRIGELDSDSSYAVLCHHGVRSAHAVGYLRSRGFANVDNISGGIEEWAQTLDPSLKRY